MSLSTHNRSFRRSLSRKSMALILTTKNNETKHHTHFKHTINKTNANKTNYIRVWCTLYDLQPIQQALYLQPGAHTGHVCAVIIYLGTASFNILLNTLHTVGHCRDDFPSQSLKSN